MFMLSSISRSLEFRSVNHISRYENTELKVFANIKLVSETPYNWQNDLLETNVNKTFESCLS